MFSAQPANAGILAQMDAHQKIGYARAAVAACPRLQVNGAGILQIMTGLSAEDQASVASNRMMTDHAESESSSLFAMLGDAACDAALDYEKKLGVDLFSESY